MFHFFLHRAKSTKPSIMSVTICSTNGKVSKPSDFALPLLVRPLVLMDALKMSNCAPTVSRLRGHRSLRISCCTGPYEIQVHIMTCEQTHEISNWAPTMSRPRDHRSLRISCCTRPYDIQARITTCEQTHEKVKSTCGQSGSDSLFFFARAV